MGRSPERSGWRRVWGACIWSPDGRLLEPDDEKRFDLRVWLPIYDILAFAAGMFAVTYATPLLYRLFPVVLVDVAGSVMIATAAVCLIGVLFPRLWPLELGAKFALAFLLSAYASTVAAFPQNPEQGAGFVACILYMATIPILMRVTKLGNSVRRALTRLSRRRRAV